VSLDESAAPRSPSPSATPRASRAPPAPESSRPPHRRDETDLFGEQAVLCGGGLASSRLASRPLEAGYQPELAYFESARAKLIVDSAIAAASNTCATPSPTPPSGETTSPARASSPPTQARHEEALDEIQDGSFAKKFINENETGRKEFARIRPPKPGIPSEPSVQASAPVCLSSIPQGRRRRRRQSHQLRNHANKMAYPHWRGPFSLPLPLL